MSVYPASVYFICSKYVSIDLAKCVNWLLKGARYFALDINTFVIDCLSPSRLTSGHVLAFIVYVTAGMDC